MVMSYYFTGQFSLGHLSSSLGFANLALKLAIRTLWMILLIVYFSTIVLPNQTADFVGVQTTLE